MSTPKKPRKTKRKKAALQQDVFQMLVPVNVTEPDRRPSSWKQVAKKVNGQLRAIVAGLFGLVSDCIAAVRKVVREVPALVPALASRVAKAHDAADKAEAKMQEQVQQQTLPAAAPQEAWGRLEEVLLGLAAKGLVVQVVEHNGRLTVIAVRPDLAEAAVACAEQSAGQDDVLLCVRRQMFGVAKASATVVFGDAFGAVPHGSVGPPPSPPPSLEQSPKPDSGPAV